MLWMILTSCVIVFFVYDFLIKPYYYWIGRGVKQGSPYHVLRNSLRTSFMLQNFGDLIENVYNMFPNERYCGVCQLVFSSSTPTIMLRDPELIKEITVKNFDCFSDHREFISEDVDSIWGSTLFALKGQRWHEMRAILSPAFNGNHMRTYFDRTLEVASQFCEHFLKVTRNQELVEVELRDIFSRFAHDVIVRTFFGIQSDSLKDKDNELYLAAREMFDFSGVKKNLKFFGYFVIQNLYKIFKVQMFDRKLIAFFRSLIEGIISKREKSGMVRLDALHLLLEAHKVSLNQTRGTSDSSRKFMVSEEDVFVNAWGFLFAGFDSVSTLMCFMGYELGLNQDIQKRLRREVEETLVACDGKLTYDAVLGMKYMNMVVSETQRKWSNAVATERICTRPYTIEPRRLGERPLTIEKGTMVWVPMWGLQRDPKYFPDPERFNPERFNDENRPKITPYTYLPFGPGPRTCLGSRLALLETKVIFIHVLLHFEIISVKRTRVPLKIGNTPFNISAKEGFWLGLRRRSDS